MRNLTRFIPGEDISEVSSWNFGDVDVAAALLREEGLARQESEQAEAARQAGYAEGFVQGRAQALLEAQKQINDFMAQQGRDTARHLAGVVESARRQLEAAEQTAGEGVLALACEMARQVLRHELSVNPNVLLPVIREALGMLVADVQAVHIRLNPIDLDVLQDAVREEFPNLALTLQPDPALTRGGCLVEAGGTVIDGRLEKRWLRTIGRLGQNLPWEEAVDDDA